MSDTAESPSLPGAKVVIRRHSLLVRVTHWVNALALAVLLMSGLNIFDAHPALYWGKQSHFDRPALSMHSVRRPDGSFGGVTTVGPLTFATTGVLGLSRSGGEVQHRGFPAWMTLPATRDLATARHWHFFFAWVLALNGLTYLTGGFASRHLQRDLWTSLGELRHIPHELWSHLQLKFPEGEAARRYNVLQKLSYSGVIFLLAPLVVLTGLTMSPGMDAVAGNLLPTVFGGRQSARTIHFLCAGGLAAFFLVHIVMVLVSGVWNNLRSMITGRYVLPQPKPAKTKVAS